VKIVVADDHALIREGLERTLKSFEEDAEIIHAEDSVSVLDKLALHSNVDIILLDLFMPGANGFELLTTICNSYSSVPVIVISSADEPRNMRKAIDCGASGFIPKSASTEIMISAFQLVCSGGVYIPPDMLKPKSSGSIKGIEHNNNAVSMVDETRTAASNLTRRQTEVLDLMARGMSNKEIARALDVSEHTIKIHVTAILKLFNAENRTEAVVMAHNAGVVET